MVNLILSQCMGVSTTGLLVTTSAYIRSLEVEVPRKEHQLNLSPFVISVSESLVSAMCDGVITCVSGVGVVTSVMQV